MNPRPRLSDNLKTVAPAPDSIIRGQAPAGAQVQCRRYATNLGPDLRRGDMRLVCGLHTAPFMPMCKSKSSYKRSA